MILRIIDRRHNPAPDDLVRTQENIFRKLVIDLGQPTWSFDLVLVEDDAMAQLNSQFRSKASVTDVLSFSYLLNEGSEPCDLATGSLGASADLWLDQLTEPGDEGDLKNIGEVILAPDFIAVRCEKQQWSLEVEFPMLVVHGALHLLGWDHEDEQEANSMKDLEEKFLMTCGFSHPLRSLEGH